MAGPNQNTEETMLAEYLVATIRDQGTGANAPECIRNYPRDVYFVGNLRSVQTAMRAVAAGSAGQIEMQTKISPFALGGQFRLRPPEDRLVISADVSWSVYYRVFPNLDQQRKHLQQAFPVVSPAQPPAAGTEDEKSDDAPEESTAEGADGGAASAAEGAVPTTTDSRSEERRVGKECRL